MIDYEKYYNNKESYLGKNDFTSDGLLEELLNFSEGHISKVLVDRFTFDNVFQKASFFHITAEIDYIKYEEDSDSGSLDGYWLAEAMKDLSVMKMFTLIQLFYPKKTENWYWEVAQLIDMESLELKTEDRWSSKELNISIEWWDMCQKLGDAIYKQYGIESWKMHKRLSEIITEEDLLSFFELESIEEDDEQYCYVDQVKRLLS